MSEPSATARTTQDYHTFCSALSRRSAGIPDLVQRQCARPGAGGTGALSCGHCVTMAPPPPPRRKASRPGLDPQLSQVPSPLMPRRKPCAERVVLVLRHERWGDHPCLRPLNPPPPCLRPPPPMSEPAPPPSTTPCTASPRLGCSATAATPRPPTAVTCRLGDVVCTHEHSPPRH
ncbi:hypothetical protein Krad_4535 (plasmid) [Kineococcus radiotolerans SRS30216 = ATCC BAA-149]|uniref:Uncharacterized protein n=1 Tax=Kineococcus radiotolerans (strain ATCC BAA-149 / DSM 14245 / SRS30216) TaxID=266940 RepID=A6WGQ5_KINRD|nr:hypothetical protein Krad_4535 [Kineococcus radiotolerans SRS30216 = ATCC BAA-149]